MKFSYIKIVIVFFIAVCNSFVYGQDLKFKRLSDEEGLSSVNVKAIHQDVEGFIWFGTQDGLNKYDGFHFTVYKSNVFDKTSISSADINCIAEDEAGKLYIGTNGSGLSVFDKHKNEFSNFNKENSNICNNVIKCICNINSNERSEETRLNSSHQ